MGEFVAATRLHDLQQEIGVCVTVNGKRIALFRIADEVFALDNVCPHEGGPLADGFVEGDAVMCPLHAWSFDLRTGRVVSGGDVSVESYPVRVNGDDVMVEVGDS